MFYTGYPPIFLGLGPTLHPVAGNRTQAFHMIDTKKTVAKYPASLQDVIEGDIVGSRYHSLAQQIQNRIENVKRPSVLKTRKCNRTEDSDTEDIPPERKAAVQDTAVCFFSINPKKGTKFELRKNKKQLPVNRRPYTHSIPSDHEWRAD
ncbi:hypothetical protein QTP70_027228 [Hemibagrus guttatus]|uniref:Uncharacterized protein n=1 Tax=Hemibagrus guttatus TaxID=175788 RepID=A0AAE0VEI0_9TELE|nr:hypothetical protein QTP70_027228 [Hemibagrus guttatus]